MPFVVYRRKARSEAMATLRVGAYLVPSLWALDQNASGPEIRTRPWGQAVNRMFRPTRGSANDRSSRPRQS